MALEWGKKGETKSLGRGKGSPSNLASLALSSLQPLIFFLLLLFYLIFKANEKGEEHSVSMHKVMPKQYVDFLEDISLLATLKFEFK